MLHFTFMLLRTLYLSRVYSGASGVQCTLGVPFADSNIIALLVYTVIFWIPFFFWYQNGVLSGRGGFGCGVVGFFRLFCL